MTSRRPAPTMPGVQILLALLMIMQVSPPATAPAPAADEVHVYVMTIGPGDAAWEKFGHNMLRVHDVTRNIDVAFNWGIFDFNNHFVWHFIQGKLWYWVDYNDTEAEIKYYSGVDRQIWQQELNLTDQQKQQIIDYCLWCVKDENKFYRYDYYTANCSTKVRDAVDLVLNGQIKKKASTMPSNVTYRSETDRLLADDWILYISLNFIMGHPVDQKLSAWDEMFIPMRMHDYLNQITITDETGREIPLVKSDEVIYQSKRAPLRDAPPHRVPLFLLAGVAIGGLEFYLARRNTRLGKWGFAIVSIFWSFLAGFAGSFLLYGTFFTDHEAVRYNENFLHLSPFMFPLVILIPLLLAHKKTPLKIAVGLSGLALLTSIVGLLLKVLPSMYQSNFNMIALAIPANAGLFWALYQMHKNTKPKEATA